MTKILGLDLGTNSIGWAISNTAPDLEIKNQIEKYGVIIFNKGVGSDKSGEFSFAKKRTEKRSVRRLYQARKYRLWSTLNVLINEGYCPLSTEGLNRWRKYDKEKAMNGDGGRAYPIEDRRFDAWIKLDFNGDGVPDYSSPYQLRAELVQEKLDISKPINKYKIGRAIYHIAQRRGFKSSRKDAVANDSGDRQDAKSELKKESEFETNFQKKFGKSLADFPSIGSALAFIEKQGERVRLEWIQFTFRKHYKEECTKIFEIQGIDTSTSLYSGLIESKRNRYDGSVFKQRPLRSQKGHVGECTLEKGKPRCPVSHPAFEEFRAMSFLNNIQLKKDDVWMCLSNALKKDLYDKLFFRVSKPYFHFEEIRNYLEKSLGIKLNFKEDRDHNLEKNINYPDKTNVSACPVSGRLKDIFGENWMSFEHQTSFTRKNKEGEEHFISYSIEDIWHVLFSFNDEELVTEFAFEKLRLEEEKVKKFETAWQKLPEGYSMLSLNAIKKINGFLREGFIYSEAVLLANIPEIIGLQLWNDANNQKIIKENIADLIKENRQTKTLLGIVNGLTAKYKSLSDNEKYGYKDNQYILTESDKKEIMTDLIETYGQKGWESKSDEERKEILDTATYLYQCTFRNGFEIKLLGDDKYHIIRSNYQMYYKSVSNQFYKLPRVVDTIADFLRINFNIKEEDLSKIYHPSMVEYYPPSKQSQDGRYYLPSPKTGAFKNPMAMRTLHELRKLLNYLIKTGQIDEETRIVVETARELNDANKRWAIETYQRQRQAENKEFADAIRGLLENEQMDIQPNPDNSDDVDKVRLWFEQVELQTTKKTSTGYILNKWAQNGSDLIQKLGQSKTLIEKYKLWKEQRCICMYTGKIISISDLFDENKVDFEHTIPRSISFDNSMANRTVCLANYNRYIKGNLIPTQLPNYDHDITIGGETYSAIKPRLKEWEEKVAHINNMIEFWRGKSKTAATKDYKDDAIRQQHLWKLELDYWKNKLDRFTITEVTSSFKNSQLIDTQLISKYAMHYLRSAFNTVEVQKGLITAEFRKILGLQSNYENKDRTKHSHHAIDASVLTLIPYPAKREKLLQLHFRRDEERKLQNWDNYNRITGELEDEVGKLNLLETNSILNEIENNILINNISRDQALAPGRKIVRKRGKIVFIKDANGNKKPKIAQGDCIRGELHKETFLGAIKLPKRDKHGKILHQNGSFIYKGNLSFVVREPLLFKKDASNPGFKSIEELKSCIVDPDLFKIIEGQIGEKSFKDALQDGIYMLNKKGVKVNKIRHVRVFVRDKEPLKLKNHVQISASANQNLPDKTYKNFYYAGNGENYAYALYQGINKNKIERGHRIINLAEAASLKKISDNGQVELEPEVCDAKGNKLQFYALLKIGQKVIFFKKDPEELRDLSTQDLSKRLYKITEFEKDGRIKFKFHLNAQKDDELGNGESAVDFGSPRPKLRITKGNFNFLIEGIDFEMNPDGNLIFL